LPSETEVIESEKNDEEDSDIEEIAVKHSDEPENDFLSFHRARIAETKRREAEMKKCEAERREAEMKKCEAERREAKKPETEQKKRQDEQKKREVVEQQLEAEKKKIKNKQKG